MVRQITLPKTGTPTKYSRATTRGSGKATVKSAHIGYREPPVKKIGTVRKKGESMKSFRVRTLKKFYREHCMRSEKYCMVSSTDELCSLLKDKELGKTYGSTKADRLNEVICQICPSPEASDDVWIKWGEFYGFRFDLNDTKKKGTITVIKEKAKAKVIAKVEKKVEKKVEAPKPTPTPTKTKATTPKKGKTKKLTDAQFNKLMNNGFVMIGKKRITTKNINNKGELI